MKKLSKPAARPPKPAIAEAGTIQVRATRPGYYDLVYRSIGDVFTLKPIIHSVTKDVISAEEQFSEKWMQRIGAGQPQAAALPQVDAPTQADDDDETAGQDVI